MRAVFVHAVGTGATHQLTDGMSDAAHPVFDRSGKYLYFSASTNVGRGLSWADLSGVDSVSTRNVYAAVLRADLPSPLAPESDEEKAKEEKKEGDDGKSDEKKKGDKKDESEEKKPDPVRIDFEGIV